MPDLDALVVFSAPGSEPIYRTLRFSVPWEITIEDYRNRVEYLALLISGRRPEEVSLPPAPELPEGVPPQPPPTIPTEPPPVPPPPADTLLGGMAIDIVDFGVRITNL